MGFEYVYAKSIGRAVYRAATCRLGEKTVFNIGNDEVTSFDQLFAAAQKLLPVLAVDIVPGIPSVSHAQDLDILAARKFLGWIPAFILEEEFEGYISDLRAALDAR